MQCLERDETRRTMHTSSSLRRKCKQFLARLLMETMRERIHFGPVCACGKPLQCRSVLIILHARAVPLAATY